jgi:4-amino-4-deoxy-L-arabinose transferase-like glycosyltransferase
MTKKWIRLKGYLNNPTPRIIHSKFFTLYKDGRVHSSLSVSPFRRLWFGLVALLIASGSGHFYASDEERMFTTTMRMWQAIRHLFDATLPVEQPILGIYGPMQSLLALSMLPIGTVLAALGPDEMQAWLVRLPMTWVNAMTVASTATLLGWYGMRHYQSMRIGMLLAITYALATPAWMYARSFFSEPTAAFFLLVAALPLFVPSAESHTRRTLYGLAGLATLAALLTKIAVAPAVAILGLSIVIMSWQQRDWHKLIAWGSGVSVAAVIFLTYNTLARGSMLSSGYGQSATEMVIRWDYITTGLYGQFLSSGKSIFLYAPLLLLWPVGVWLQRRERHLTLTCLGVIGAVVFIHTNVIYWHGDGAWGPRYLILCLPFMVWPLGAVYQWLAHGSHTIRRAILIPLISATVLVQMAGLSINLNAVIIDTRNQQARYYDPQFSPIMGHWRALTRQITADVQRMTQPGVTLAGWSYSEGDRTLAEQFPRFAGPDASIIITPMSTTNPQLMITYHSCHDSSNQMRVDVLLDRRTLSSTTPCPPRHMHILLPSRPSQLLFAGTGVHIDGLPHHAWYDTLGATVLDLRVYDHVGVYPIWANLTPPSRMPATPNEMIVWASDSRPGFYDYWWYYLSAVPRSASVMPVCIVIIGIIITLLGLAWRPPMRQTKEHQTAKQ